MDYRYFLITLVLHAHIALSDDVAPFITQTVYGFLDFTTTIGNTVMVFSPQSAPAIGNINLPADIIETKPLSSATQENNIKPTKLAVSVKSSTNNVKVESNHPSAKLSIKSSTMVNGHKNDFINNTIERAQTTPYIQKAPTLQIENSVFEYDLLSRQPAEYAEETYRVINVKTNTRDHDKPRNRNSLRRTHEVATVSAESYESNRVKSSQVSERQHSSQKNKRAKIRPTSSLRVLKTTAPSLPKANANEHKNNRVPGSNRQSIKSFKGNDNDHVTIVEPATEPAPPTQHKKTSGRNKPKRKSKHSRTAAAHKSTTVILASSSEPNRKTLRTKVKPSNVEAEASTSLYMFKLNRTPGRWQYKTTPKPRIAIRKFTETTLTNVTKQLDLVGGSPNLNVINEKEDLESSGSQNGAIINNIDQANNPNNLLETLNVEISTPADFKDTYYELATIKTPYAFQVGGIKKTRFITVTSTFEKTLTPDPTETQMRDGPLTENILAPSTRELNFLRDSSISTLRPIHVSDNEETPSLETVTESFSTTQKRLRTQVLPIVYDNNNETSYMTLTHTYDVTSLITVTKTLSPLETDQFMALKSFKDFGGNLDEAGSEINLELEFGDSDNGDSTNEDKHYRPKIANISDLFELSKSGSGNLTAEEIQRLALWKLQNGSLQYSSLIAPTVIPFKQESSIMPIPSIIPPPPSINPFLLPVQQFQTITSSLVQQAITTQTNSKVLKLTFGAKTAYTTIFSSEVVPTLITTYITTSIPVQPTAAFPGYFPPPYPQYYLG